MTAEPFIRLRNVRKVYRSQGAEFLAVSDVTMDVSEGELTSLVDGDARVTKSRELVCHAVPHPRVGGQAVYQQERGPG